MSRTVARRCCQSASVAAAHRAIASESIFGFGDASAALADDGELGERERVVGFEFNDPLGVSDRLVKLPEFVHDHRQCRMRQRVRGRRGDNAEERGCGTGKIALVFESVRVVIEFVGRRHLSGFLSRVDSGGSSVSRGSLAASRMIDGE